MNSVPALSTASEIGSVSGAPENNQLSAGQITVPVPSQFNDPCQRFPSLWGCRRRRDRHWHPGQAAAESTSVKSGGGKCVEAIPVRKCQRDHLIVIRIRDEDCARCVETAMDCGCCIRSQTSAVRRQRRPGLVPKRWKRKSERKDGEEKLPLRTGKLCGIDGITDMATALLYNFGSVIPSLRGGY